jgi:protocatechuate 3,4-dioxygenase beta subunit
VSCNVTVWSCARHGSIRGGATWLVAAGLAAITLWVSVEPAVRAAADGPPYAFAGTVVDPQGKPVAGAKVWFDYPLAGPPAQPVPADAVTDAEGKFQFSRTKSSLADTLESPYPTPGVLVATKEEFGFAAGPADRFETTGRLAVDRPKLVRRAFSRVKREVGKEDRVLRLALDDVPLHGAILNTDGQPVAGATVEVLAVWAGENGTLDAWEAGMKKQPFWQNVSALFGRYNGAGAMAYIGGRRRFGAEAGLWDLRVVPVAGVKSDAAGRFTLNGIGRERLVELLIRAAGSETAHKFARTRAGETIEIRNQFARGMGEIAASKCTFELGSSPPIQGQVVESGTGRALAGVRVVATSALTVRTVTDSEGHYRLEGVPLEGAMLEVIPPSGTRNLPVDVNVSTALGTTVARRDIAVPAAVLAHGRAIDERTGKPVAGTVNYFAYQTNPELQKAQEWNFRGRQRGVQTDAEGRFAIPVLAGPGILAFRAGAQFHFGVGAEQINCPTYEMPVAARAREGKVFRTMPGLCQSELFNLLVPLDPRPEAQEVTVDLKLRSGVEVTARVRTIDGRQPGTYYVLGAGEENAWMEQNEDRFTIVGCFPEETRRLFLYQPARNLVASVDVTGVPPEPIEIRLRPGASVTGRLLEADGNPVEGAYVISEFVRLRAAVGHLAEMQRDVGRVPAAGGLFTTDEKGRFEIKGLIPGLKYMAQFVIPRQTGNVRGSSMGPRVVTIFTDLTLKSRETKDLGDVRAKPPEPRRAPIRRVPQP